MIKYLIIVFIVALVVLSAGCASEPEVITVPKYVTHLQHPETLKAPNDPGVAIKVITAERIADGEIPDKAYVGFLYNDWLEFSKWMHDYRAHNKSLKKAIEAYQAQDSRNSELPNDQ